MRAIALAAALALSACQTTTAVVTACPPLRTYSATEQAALAVEVAGLPAGSALLGMVMDYGRMRDADRACMAAKP